MVMFSIQLVAKWALLSRVHGLIDSYFLHQGVVCESATLRGGVGVFYYKIFNSVFNILTFSQFLTLYLFNSEINNCSLIDFDQFFKTTAKMITNDIYLGAIYRRIYYCHTVTT